MPRTPAQASAPHPNPLPVRANERDGERELEESQHALAALTAYLGELPLRVTERRNLGPDTLWHMIVRSAD